MRADLLAALALQVKDLPRGVAARIDSQDLATILRERHALLSAASFYLKARTAEEYDSSRKGLITAVSLAVKP